MGMFLNYHNIADNYRPNNLIQAYPQASTTSKLNPVAASKPYEEYNTKGELSGYFWHYGETLNLEFTIDGEITIESNALIIKTRNLEPTTTTVGTIGQRVYNIVDLRSWTCIGILRGEYIWEEDEEFTYPLNSDKSVYISSEDYLNGKNVEVTLYNFRMEPICKKIYAAKSTIIFTIDKELSSQLFKGIYYCSVKVFDKDVSVTVFDTNDCTLLVK